MTFPVSAPVAPSASAEGVVPGGTSASSLPTAPTTPTASTASSAPDSPASAPPVGGAVIVGDINAPKSFDPKPTLVALKPKLLDCFNQARAVTPGLHGKLTVRIVVNEAGTALSAEADATPGQGAYDPVLVKCIDGVVKAGVKFPKPGGMATVSAPLLFRP